MNKGRSKENSDSKSEKRNDVSGMKSTGVSRGDASAQMFYLSEWGKGK